MRMNKLMILLATVEILSISIVTGLILILACNRIQYDVNHDGEVNVFDAVVILNYIKGE